MNMIKPIIPMVFITSSHKINKQHWEIWTVENKFSGILYYDINTWKLFYNGKELRWLIPHFRESNKMYITLSTEFVTEWLSIEKILTSNGIFEYFKVSDKIVSDVPGIAGYYSFIHVDKSLKGAYNGHGVPCGSAQFPKVKKKKA